MTKTRTARLAAALCAAGLVFSSAQAAPVQQPYAGQQNRAIKALSPAEIDGYLNGRGMGLAKSAELNHYPGPLHLRQLATDIALSEQQLAAIAPIEAAMKSAAKRLGEEIIAHERQLDTLFASGAADAAAVRRLTVKIGQLIGELRAVHLEAHVRVRPLLTQHQVHLYNRLRGYGGGAGSHTGHGRH